MFADAEGTLLALNGRTGAPLSLGLRASIQATSLVVEPGERGPFTETRARGPVARRRASPEARLRYSAPDGTLVLTPLHQLPIGPVLTASPAR